MTTTRPSPRPVAALLLLLLPACQAEYCAVAPPSPAATPHAPNFLLVLTDDLDQALGSTEHALPKTLGHFRAHGATAENWFIHTPVCCPSRAELLTSRYFHNLKTPGHAGGCMGIDVSASNASAFYADYYFAPHFQSAGYTVGIFGKHLNSANVACPPPGVDTWFVNGGGDYYSPEFTWATAGQPTPPTNVKFQNCTPASGDGSGSGGGPCYSTTVIGEQAQAWLRRWHASPAAASKPFFAYVAFKAPHIQDGSGWPVPLIEPKYNASFTGVLAPRTPNYNITAADHHWMVRTQPPLTAEQADRTDELYRARLRALLSVDDQVEQLLQTLEDIGAADNTYVVFTSDHGYRFGQFGMAMGKWNVYENDVRIPFLISGPGVPKNATFAQIASQVDTMPTLLGLAGLVGTAGSPPTMDGRSLAPHLLHQRQKQDAPAAAVAAAADDGGDAPAPWRTAQLIEYRGLGNVVRYEHLCDTFNNTFRALRIIDPAAPEGKRNLKYVEFINDQTDWDWKGPVLEYELFDLAADPFETKNVYASFPDRTFVAGLHESLASLYSCRGSGDSNTTACN